jgi:hypothetical protein
MEKVIRAATISNNAATTKEFHYLMRYLAPAASRNPAIFKGEPLFHYLMRYLAPAASRNPVIFKG